MNEKETAQATPEGGQDLPPLPPDTGLLRLAESWAYDFALGQSSTMECQRKWQKVQDKIADQMRDYARAALAAGRQAAEPVAWADVLRFGARVIELYDDATMREGNYMLSSTECAGILEALASYRAAPPQQVDESGLPG